MVRGIHELIREPRKLSTSKIERDTVVSTTKSALVAVGNVCKSFAHEYKRASFKQVNKQLRQRVNHHVPR